ncbi:integrator complex subunit 1 isoform X1 [Bactrocera dorsalis]|uniref:Integrator complex subunit 1 isoform X1 n=1 Tax=Bactrocera dorsalis TaxID=27457 RepID=A0ABM3JD26_BACDO|nr:integrator complex subunit 1 isoform X1 [Bactrocera dorsalis]
MDRGKGVNNARGQKKSSGPMGNEFFALGAKSSREDTKKISSCKGNNMVSDRKREAPSTVSNASKKAKLMRFEESSGFTIHESWDQFAIECETTNLINAIKDNIDQFDDNFLRIVCGSVKQLMEPYTRNKIDYVLYYSLFYLAKLKPNFFRKDILSSALLYILRRDVNIKIKQSSNSQAIASNLLTKAFYDRNNWPEYLIRIYIEDAINERIWADNDFCMPYIKNICYIFNTKIPPNNAMQLETPAFGGSVGQQHREMQLCLEDDSGDGSSNTIDSMGFGIDTDAPFLIANRFSDIENTVEKMVVDAIKEQLNKRQQTDWYTRNFLKFLCSTAGLGEVRYLCITRLELWIHNGKLVKYAQQLLYYICYNIKDNHIKDHEVLAILVKIRLKTKPSLNFFMFCIKEMIIQQPKVLRLILKLVVQNELSNTRNPNNMGMLATMFQTSPEQSSHYLAEIYKEFLLQREDCLRTLRVFLRELVRVLRYDMNIVKFCKSFMSTRIDLMEQVEHSEFKERIFHSMVDIICLCMLLSVSPQIREACILLRSNKEIKNNPLLLNFYNQMSQIQLEAVSWMYETVPNLFKIQSSEYSQALHKLLLLDSPEQYSRCDQWPSEPERGTLLRIVSETPVLEDTLLRIILIGITKDIPLTIPETIDIIMMVIKRASSMRILNYPAVQANKYDVIDFLFNMVEYHYPENINLPLDYVPPKLAITILYWKAWIIMLMISAHNPSTFGAFCWKHYPTMKALIEMCITNQFSEQNPGKEELQLVSLEKAQILQLESYLAAQTSQAIITEDNAILISQLMLMDPMGQVRRIPNSVLEQVKGLNKSLKLGYLLCRCRRPDLLLDIIQRQGTTKSMPWLSDLVQSSEGDFSHLPVQCLCEFLLFNTNAITEENNRDGELVCYLRNLVMEEQYQKRTVCEVLDYIFRRLSSTVKQSRNAAICGLKIIFKDNTELNDWLLKSIPQIPCFKEALSFIIPQLRSACQVENSPLLVMAYIQFVAAHTINDGVIDMLDHVIDMAQLIVERSTMFQHIIPANGDLLLGHNDSNFAECQFQTLKCLFVMFNNYIIRLREHREPYEWTEYPDLLMVQFEDGAQLPLHLNIIHAFIILLTQSSSQMPESLPILDYWFPPGRRPPSGFLPNMPHEAVQLLPDWLKLKMIRSSVDRLIEAALLDLTPDQIVLFVQNFGTPVISMSKLLALLDHAVNEELELVKSAILNKAYLAQLIEIQQKRGAKNGHFTVKALELYSHSQTVPDNPRQTHTGLGLLSFEKSFQPLATTSHYRVNKDIEDIIGDVLKTSHYHCLSCIRFRRLINHFLDRDFLLTKNRRELMTSHLKKGWICLLRIIDRYKRLISQQTTSQIKHTCTFLRVLLKQKFITSNEFGVLFEKLTECETLWEVEMNLKGNIYVYIKSLVIIIKRKENEFFQISSKAFGSIARKPTIEDIKMLFGLKKEKISGEVEFLCHCGLIVDRLCEIDSEFTNLRKQNQIGLLFTKNCADFRFHMLSLICHQMSWGTVLFTLKLLMHEMQQNIDSSTALNFVEALINNPKLWQGRDKSISKTNFPEIMFLLDEVEMNALISFIINEADSSFHSILEVHDYKICSRISLLFRITRRKHKDISKLIEYMFRKSCPHLLKIKIIHQMYLLHPSIRFMTNNLKEHETKITTLRGCKADKVSNYLITCLGNLFLRKDFETLSSDIEMLIRKFAASHPILFLRQLGVLSSLIQGRAQLGVRLLRDEYHFHRFIQILRALQLLQPMLFDDSYKTEFQAALECYFSFFKHHSFIKESYHILIKFVELLQAYINSNPSSALLYLEKYVGILMELSIKFNSITSLHQLVQGIALLQQKGVTINELNDEENKHDFELEEHVNNNSFISTDCETSEATSTNLFESNNKGGVQFSISAPFTKPLTLSQHFTDLITIIKNSSTEETILGPLQEIESLTSKRFSYLNEVFDRLLELIFSPSAQIRSNAFILLVRHLKHNPGRSDINLCTLNAYIQCLRDDNSSVATTAVDNLVEMTLLLQEHTVEILSVAFTLGVKSQLNTSTQIKRVLQTLMLQHGY